MAFGGLSVERKHQPVAEINMIPLIDVMLVLLVIFIITAPLLTHAVKIDLPRASSQPVATTQRPVQVSVDSAGRVYWEGQAVEIEQLRQRMSEAVRLDPQPELHIRGDGEVAYRYVVSVMSEAAKAGLTRVGFITEPITESTR
ncbi:MAG: hypothetical protein RLZZ344_1141 [Pseudomonadota bacterium]